MTGPYDRVRFHGSERVTRRQRQALLHVEDKIGMEFTVPQGSWQQATTYSGKTHTGAGVCDIWLPRMDDEKWANHVTRILRAEGRQMAFLRGPWDNMPYHWHVLDLDTTGMAPDAVWQVAQGRLGNNGLTAGVPDRNPYRPDPFRKWRYIA
jgi:hypothetical protein